MIWGTLECASLTQTMPCLKSKNCRLWVNHIHLCTLPDAQLNEEDEQVERAVRTLVPASFSTLVARLRQVEPTCDDAQCTWYATKCVNQKRLASCQKLCHCIYKIIQLWTYLVIECCYLNHWCTYLRAI